MDLLKTIYDRYVAKGGALTFDEVTSPLGSPLVAIGIDDDGKGVLVRWEAIFDELGVAKPTQKQLDDAVKPPPAAAPTVPQSVSRAQAKIALHRAGLLDLVRTAVADDPEVQIWFDDALTWDRQNAHVVALGEQLIGDAAGVDALFITAAQIAA